MHLNCVMNFTDYQPNHFFDEYFLSNQLQRPAASLLIDTINHLPEGDLKRRQEASEISMRNMGITFQLYEADPKNHRTIPFDIVPRIIAGEEWDPIERGLEQRIRAINMFLQDVYNERNIIADGVIPEELIVSSKGYRPECVGLQPPNGIWAHVTGTDLIRNHDGTFYVLEDNLCVPSGVSYALINRQLMKRNFPEVFHQSRVRQIIDYPDQFNRILNDLSPAVESSSTTAILTPGMHNAAYFEHAFLAQQMGALLVEGRDLIYDGKYICARTVDGLKRIDVIYRRIDDTFLDPEVFNKESVLGCGGLMRAYREGQIMIANAPGTGVADDKVIYAYMPEIVRYYTGEEALIKNVPTRLCWRPDDLEYTLEHLSELVVKPASECGGYGILIGPQASSTELDQFRTQLLKNPRNYISQPTLNFSRVPVLQQDHFEGRHVDLRPFILYSGSNCHVLPGGLTRVALKPGSLVVNSSQGGGTKDTWITDLPVRSESFSC